MNALVTTPADVGKGIYLRSDGLADRGAWISFHHRIGINHRLIGTSQRLRPKVPARRYINDDKLNARVSTENGVVLS